MRSRAVIGVLVLISTMSSAYAEDASKRKVPPPAQDSPLYKEVMRDAAPDVDPESIKKEKARIERQKRASAEPVTQLIAVEDTIILPASPDGKGPPMLRMAAGYTTSIEFLDSTGQPWPVGPTQPGSDQWDVKPAQDGGHILWVTPKAEFTFGNLMVMLQGYPETIAFTLTTDPKFVDYKKRVRVPARGPKHTTPIVRTPAVGPENADPVLVSILDGIPSTELAEVRFTNALQNTRGWRRNGLLYVRTPYTVLSPQWTQTASTPKGSMSVFAMTDTPILLLSVDGQVVELRTME